MKNSLWSSAIITVVLLMIVMDLMVSFSSWIYFQQVVKISLFIDGSCAGCDGTFEHPTQCCFSCEPDYVNWDCC